VAENISLHLNSEIKEIQSDPSNYDLLLIGTPTWAGKAVPAVKTYLANNKDKIKNVAFFCTYNNLGGNETLEDICKCSGIAPVSTMSINKKERKNGYEDKLKLFLDEISKVNINAR
jgi:flavodoxin